jgi:hypothetical protein
LRYDGKGNGHTSAAAAAANVEYPAGMGIDPGGDGEAVPCCTVTGPCALVGGPYILHQFTTSSSLQLNLNPIVYLL